LPHPFPGVAAALWGVQDGFELTWAVNVAAPFLLTACLLPAVTDRVVNVASISAASSIDFGNLQQVGWLGSAGSCLLKDALHCCQPSLPGFGCHRHALILP
jgi:NAD(P)-dependent dehydrogenase (short-subunit alcohol dehydrogenase family)